METVQHEDGAAKDVDGAQDGGVMAWRNAANPGNPALLNLILNGSDCLPLISSIGITPDGRLMNVNADDAAMAVAEMLSADLALLSDVPGILMKKKAIRHPTMWTVI